MIAVGRVCPQGRPVPGWIGFGVISSDVTRFTTSSSCVLQDTVGHGQGVPSLLLKDRLPDASPRVNTVPHDVLTPVEEVERAGGRPRGLRQGLLGEHGRATPGHPPSGPFPGLLQVLYRSNKTTRWPG